MEATAHSWEIKALRELPLQIIDGDRSARYPKRSEFQSSGVLFLNTTNIVDDRLDLNDSTFVTEEKFAEIKKGRAQRNDILMTTRGSIGKVALFNCEHNAALINAQMLILRADVSKLDPHFLFHSLRSPNFKKELTNFASGSAQPQIPISDLREVGLPIPPLPIQRRIASILSAYDELIENNQRRIRILEDMARSLYREWFVHFRYPGHESVPLVDSPLGQIPQGWEVKKLGDIAIVNRTQINAKNAPDELHYIDIASVSPGQIDYVTTYAFANAPGRARRVVQHGDVLWSCVRPNRRSHALVMHPETNTIASTGFAVLTAKTVPFTFLYFATTTDDFVSYLTNNASGAAYPAVTATTFEKAELLIPSPALLEHFGEATIAMAEQAHTLQRQTANLRRTRDLLLPRLLSGQVNLGEN